MTFIKKILYPALNKKEVMCYYACHDNSDAKMLIYYHLGNIAWAKVLSMTMIQSQVK